MNKTIDEKMDASMLPICNTCQHHIKGMKCKAFDVIPDEIIFGKNKHTKTIKEQHGTYTYTKKV